MPTLRYRLLTPFRTLGWKLTLSYTLVTVSALLVVEAALLITGLRAIQNPTFLAQLITQTIIASTPHIVPFLDKTPPDTESLQNWLLSTAVTGLNTSSGTIFSAIELQFFPFEQKEQFTTDSPTKKDTIIAILNPQKDVLAIVPEGASLPNWPQIADTVEIALTGTTNPALLFNIIEEQKVVVAVPIQASDGKVIGIILYADSEIPTNIPSQGFFPQFIPLLALSAFVFTIIAGLVGAVFGLLTSRSLVHRLQAVSKAADAWSDGDFTIAIPEHSNDELGQLALRLNKMSEQLKTLMQTRQEFASLEERNRLARELHDSVKQQVFATAMQVGAARELLNTRPEESVSHLSEAERLARLAQQELTALIRELRPAALEGRGLAAALRDYLDNWSQQNDIQSELRVQGERALPLEMEQTIYRIAQEALSNAARHSGASLIEVHLAWQDNNLTLTITDNGHGFDPSSNTHKGIGLDSMSERAEALGGSLRLKSSESGTKVEITCPIQPLVQKLAL